jgi:RNA polymerase sigma-70 factor (ECF subfamily)
VLKATVFRWGFVLAKKPTVIGNLASRTRTSGTPASTDERLVERSLAGEREAFEQLVRRHQKALVNHLYRLTGQRESALDLAQDVFIKVYVSLRSFDPRYRFTTWLYRIASNCAIDHLRRKQPQVCSFTRARDDERREPAEDSVPGSDPSPHDMLRARELADRLEASVRALPNRYRQLLLLRHRQHCRYDEIARITSLPLGTVKNRIFRGREMLRHMLADQLGEGDA